MPVPACSPRTRWLFAFALALASAAAAAVPGAALADPPADGPDADVTHYRFDDDLVHGGVPRPAAEHLYARRRNERESLVRVRTQYVRELLESAERL